MGKDFAKLNRLLIMKKGILERMWAEDKKFVGAINELNEDDLTAHLIFTEKMTQSIEDLDKNIIPLYQEEKKDKNQDIELIINSCNLVCNDLVLFNQQITAFISKEMNNVQSEIIGIKKEREMLAKYKPKREIVHHLNFQG